MAEQNNIIVRGENLTKQFGQDAAAVVAVDHVDIAIEKGELVVITGDSGCGKTTLVSLLGCILTPDEGKVWLDGHTIDHIQDDLPAIRRGKVGFVFQLFNLIPYLSALENVLTPMDIAGVRRDVAEDKAKELLRQVGLGDRFYHRPAQLSGGEKQRVSFARALANNPKIVFADEPTANIDSKQSANLLALVRELQEEYQTTTAIVTHQEELHKHADRLIRMKDGCVL